jgi:methyl-accepting chemotaxis protein
VGMFTNLFGQEGKAVPQGTLETLSRSIPQVSAAEAAALLQVQELQQQLRSQGQILAQQQGRLQALDRVQAVIEFDTTGIILSANSNFLEVMGYQDHEVLGKHHSLFIDPAERNSRAYAEFWQHLRAGEVHHDVFRRLGKNGREVWIRASYNPVYDSAGQLQRIVKFATDITQQKLEGADIAGKMTALQRSQAIIEFSLDGIILEANDNFLAAMGYRRDEIVGRHHSMFVPPGQANSRAYQQFWEQLNRGEFDQGEYLRLGQGGREIWIQASYNPVYDVNGRLCKVVKFASDISAQKQMQAAIAEVMADSSRVMHCLSDGILSEHMNSKVLPEFRPLTEAVNGYIDRMNSMVGDIKQAATAVKQGSAEIASGNDDLSRRSEQQAANLEQTAAAMEEITVTVQRNAGNAAEANTLARSARDVAEKGGAIVSKAVVAMQAISASSNRINDIIGVIDELAFQTNLLALNAAVEAARAGDQGRGFAVVADEVRNLAGRSASAAREIKELIRDSSDKVREGTSLVNSSGEMLGEIVASVKKVNQIISEIAVASEEQATGIEEVKKSVMQMDEMTQQNSALVEEAAAASAQLGQQADQLEQLVDFFRH